VKRQPVASDYTDMGCATEALRVLYNATVTHGRIAKVAMVFADSVTTGLCAQT